MTIFFIFAKTKTKKMKKILLTVSLLLTVSFSFAQDAEKENLKKNEEAATRKTDDIPDGWEKSRNCFFFVQPISFQ
jgi:hypothetical protein